MDLKLAQKAMIEDANWLNCIAQQIVPYHYRIHSVRLGNGEIVPFEEWIKR